MFRHGLAKLALGLISQCDESVTLNTEFFSI
jgi:hypothetical protein